VTTRAATAAARIAERERVLRDFLAAEHDSLARACLDMAKAFHRGGVLLAYGTGAAASDAAHVAVEFMHPIIVGKRALPAVAPRPDPEGLVLTGVGRAGDIALGLAHRTGDPAVSRFLDQAARRGLTTIALTAVERADAHHAFAVPSDDPAIVQEVQETAYHLLWELVHVFFEHPGLLEETCATCGDVAVTARVVHVEETSALVERDGRREEIATDLLEELHAGELVLCHAGVALERVAEQDAPRGDDLDPAAFLYPFLDSREADAEHVLADVAASTITKGADTIALRRQIDIDAIGRCAAAIRTKLEAGGRLLAFGNGGSATDAQDAAADALECGWPALALVDDAATITAVGNDIGFELVFARQLIALVRPGDVALAFSTSGSSPSILTGLEEAHRRGALTCAVTGYAGGQLTDVDWLDHLMTVPGDYVPRLQEAHATMWHLLIEEVTRR
jgi:D-sedoheptulose 7-phosphate isomerase